MTYLFVSESGRGYLMIGQLSKNDAVEALVNYLAWLNGAEKEQGMKHRLTRLATIEEVESWQHIELSGPVEILS